ncbi:MAG TPA: sulfite exporter TauE/SafE family protein [Paracoccaceae bacterium]|nr:sulfite exporter TauE/SafE family protein [Paracoccaceae bacterium]
MLTAQTVVLVVAAFALGGFVKGAIGMGLPVVVLTLLVLVMPLKAAMAIFLIPGVAANLWQATNGPYLPGLARRLWPYLLASVLGIVAGVFLTADAPTDPMVMVLGGLLILYSVFSLAGPRLPQPGRHEHWLSPLAGASGGVMFGMVGVYTVPGLLYLETLRLPRDQMVQGLGLTFVTISTTLLLSMAGVDLVTSEMALLSVLGLAPAFAGIWAGRRIRHRISETFYRRLFFIALIASGIYMIANAMGVFG